MTRLEGQHWNEMLRDRSRVVVRPIRRDDAPRIAALVDGLSPESRHLLFLAGIAALSERELHCLCDPDFAHDMAYVAVDAADAADADDGIVGLGRYVHDEAGGGAELSIAVADAWQHRGLGTLLLRHLIEAARAHGLRRLYSVDAASNHWMRRLASHLGFRSHTDPADARQVIFSLELDGGAADAGEDE